jgi:DNA-binding NarL/FixJ family response regulator
MNRRELLKALSAIPLSPIVLNGWKAWAHGTTINPARKPQQQVRLVFAGYSPTFRDALRYLFQAKADLKVVGEASDGAEAVQLARQLKPDILLLNLIMPRHPGMTPEDRTGGMKVLRELGDPENPTPVRVIVLTAEIGKSQMVEALQLGARGVLLKSSPTETLFKAIQTVMADGYWVGREQVSNLEQYLRTLIQSIDEEARRRGDQARRLRELSPRELEIVSAVVYLRPTYNGAPTDKEIAEHLKISEDAVKRTLRNIFDKLGVYTRLELALFAFNQGLPLKSIV